MKRNKDSEWPIYLRAFLLAWGLVGVAATIQGLRVYQENLQWQFFIVPALVATILGLMMARMAVLKHRLREKSALFRAIADQAHELTYFRSKAGHYEYVSPSSELILGYSPDAFYADAELMERLIHPDDSDRWRRHQEQVNSGVEPDPLDVRMVTRDGETVWLNHVCAPVFGPRGDRVGVRSSNLDITERRLAQESVEHMAYYDPLTGLPNRRLIRKRIDEYIHTDEGQGGAFAVMFLDLNRFKNINDSFGHAFGDRLLKQVSERISGACDDQAIVGRFGGDEFLFLVPGAGEREAIALAEQVLQAVEQPLSLDWMELCISGSVGIALYPGDGRDAEELIRNADVAMYKTKGAHRGRVELYSVHLSTATSYFVTTEHMIHQALRRREFPVHYQPKVDMIDGSIVGLEALVRWQHPERGLLGPEEFVPVAEETGQIIELGWQVFEQVLADMVRWGQQGITVPVAVNVSARQFADTTFCNRVKRAIRESGCEPRLICIEITEQVLLGDVELAAGRLKSLRDEGMSLALDDFGTGYSSLNYLRQLPINVLKIDRSFISDVADDTHSRAVLRAVISLCRDLKLDAIVEGVESATQRDILLDSGCRWAQGFFYYAAQPAEAIDHLLGECQAAL